MIGSRTRLISGKWRAKSGDDSPHGVGTGCLEEAHERTTIVFPVVVFDDVFEVHIATDHRELEEIMEGGTMAEVQGVFDSAGRTIVFAYRERPQPSFATNVVPAQFDDVQRCLRGNAAHAVFPVRLDRPESQDLSLIIEEIVEKVAR